MTGTKMSTGSSVVKNNQLSQLPFKHLFIAFVLRVPEMEIPLSALSISFCQQAGKEREKDVVAVFSMKKICHPPPQHPITLQIFFANLLCSQHKH